MILKKITLCNFLAIKDERTIQFSTDTIKPFTIIVGDNGAGKTTICNAVKWCLFEEISERKSKTIKNKFALETDDVYVEIEAQVKRSTYKIKRRLLGRYTDLLITKNSNLIKDAENELRLIAPIFLNEAVVINGENFDGSIFYESQPPARRNFIFDLLFDSSLKITTHTMVLNTFFKDLLGNKIQINIDPQTRIINIVGPDGKEDIRDTMGSGDIRVINIYLIMALNTLIHKEALFPIFFDSAFSALDEKQKFSLMSLFMSSKSQIIFLERPEFLESNLFQKALKDKSSKNSRLNFSATTNTLEITSL